jgi:hypothetical protein
MYFFMKHMFILSLFMGICVLPVSADEGIIGGGEIEFREYVVTDSLDTALLGDLKSQIEAKRAEISADESSSLEDLKAKIEARRSETLLDDMKSKILTKRSEEGNTVVAKAEKKPSLPQTGTASVFFFLTFVSIFSGVLLRKKA